MAADQAATAPISALNGMMVVEREIRVDRGMPQVDRDRAGVGGTPLRRYVAERTRKLVRAVFCFLGGGMTLTFDSRLSLYPPQCQVWLFAFFRR